MANSKNSIFSYHWLAIIVNDIFKILRKKLSDFIKLFMLISWLNFIFKISLNFIDWKNFQKKIDLITLLHCTFIRHLDFPTGVHFESMVCFHVLTNLFLSQKFILADLNAFVPVGFFYRTAKVCIYECVQIDKLRKISFINYFTGYKFSDFLWFFISNSFDSKHEANFGNFLGFVHFQRIRHFLASMPHKLTIAKLVRRVTIFLN